MNIPCFVPFVNRRDLLDRLLPLLCTASVYPMVINNSDEYLQLGIGNHINPPVPLTFTQSQNWMLKWATGKAPFYMWAHCDAMPEEGTVQKLCERAMAECAKRTKWGAIYTHYDILCAYSVEAMTEIGGYDTNFFDYMSDCDVYRRMDLGGWERINSGIPCGHDQGSQTIRSDPKQNRRVGVQVPYRAAYYQAKWGGQPGRETFQTAWGE